jgi:hypothetical protein
MVRVFSPKRSWERKPSRAAPRRRRSAWSDSAIGGGPLFHPRCVHVLTPFVGRLATEEEKKAGVMLPEVLNRTPAELRRMYRKEH